ncbi:MAG: thioesterase family protein [Rhizobiales bacterium]|nr:thioesterase family protein [Hyphomicrobiales bacterium]
MSPTDRPKTRTLTTGLVGRATCVVTDDMLATAMGSGTVPVYATPSLVALMEQAAVACVEPHLAIGEASLGLRIDAHHTAPSLPGQTVQAEATLTAIDGRKLILAIEARTSTELIGTATHTRVVVDVTRFLAKLAAKSP